MFTVSVSKKRQRVFVKLAVGLSTPKTCCLKRLQLKNPDALICVQRQQSRRRALPYL